MAVVIGIAELLDQALKAQKIPIEGVSIGDPADRTTWTAQYHPHATEDERKAGDAILATLDPTDAVTMTAIKGERASARLEDDLLSAIIEGLYEAIPAPTMKLADVRAQILKLYQARL